MKAIRIHEHGGPEVLKYDEVPDPKPGPGQVLLEIKAASVNHLDIWVRQGIPGMKIPMPRILGGDAAGIVREVEPGAARVKPGQRVLLNPAVSCGHCEYCSGGNMTMCLDFGIWGEHADGTYGSLMAVPETSVHAIPDSISFEEAAAAPLTYTTAWRMMVSRGRLKAGEDVLIHSAGAGVGVAALQIAKLAGARVIATASTAEKCEMARSIGADFVVNHAKEDVVKRVREITAKRGVDLVVDYVGRDTWAGSLLSLRRGGRLVTCGATSGYDPAEDIRHIFYRQLEIIGSTMGNNEDFANVLRSLFRGRFKPVIHGTWPLREAAEAHRRIEARATFGKVVLIP